MEKVSNSSSNKINDGKILDITKMISRESTSGGKTSFKDALSVHSRMENISAKDNAKINVRSAAKEEKDFSKVKQSEKNTKQVDSKKQENKPEVKNDADIKDESSKKTDQTENKKTEETKVEEETDEVAATEKKSKIQDKNLEKISFKPEDMVYVTTDFIKAFKELQNLQESGVVITEEKVQELFKDVKALDLSEVFESLNEENQRLLQNNQGVTIDVDDLTSEVKNLIFKLQENQTEEKSDVKKIDLDIFKNSQNLDLDEEIKNLKQDINSGLQNTKVVNKIQNNQVEVNLSKEFNNLENEIKEDYSNIQVKITGSHANVNTESRISLDMANQIQNFSKIIDEINVAYRTNKNTINIKLEPETLGELTVRIHSENGVVQASFMVENERARKAIEDQLQELRDTLVQQGVNIANIDVQVGQNQEDFNLHKNIMEASRYSAKLEFNNSDNGEESFEELKNPYISEDLFNDIV